MTTTLPDSPSSSSPTTAAHIVIIGGGIGGLATAIRLASAGLRVTLFERNERVGGKLNLIEADGFTFDTGPSLFTMPDIARDLFASAGASLDDEMTLLPLETICRYYYPDGVMFDAPGDIRRMAAELESFSETDARGFERFIDYGRRVYDITAQPFLFSPLRNLGVVGLQLLRRLYRPLDIARVIAPITLDRLVGLHFRDPHLRQLFDRYATYNGSTPYRTPAVYSIIPYVEYAFGAWYPAGGMYRLAETLSDLAIRTGVTIQTDTPVSRILIEGRRAVGVELADGRRVDADAVVSNVDIATSYRRFLSGHPAAQKRLQQLNRLEPSLSGFVLLLGTNRTYPELQHHTIFFSRDYRTEFYDIFDRLVAPRDPTIYVCATSRTDPTQAPAGHENLFILVNAPRLSPEFSWEAEARDYRNLVLEKLEQMGLADLRQHIVFEQMITPLDLESRYGAQYGSIYGFSSNNLFAPFQRPQNRSREFAGLYFTGGSVHPGGGLPLVMLSGKITARLVQDDLVRRKRL